MNDDNTDPRLAYDGARRGHGLRILIAEPNSFFAQDMLAGLKEAAPGARVASFPSLVGLRQHLTRIVGATAGPGEGLGHDRLVVIMSGTLEELRAAGLDQEVERRGGRLVVVQGYDSDRALAEAGVIVLPTPFTPTGLARLVERLLL